MKKKIIVYTERLDLEGDLENVIKELQSKLLKTEKGHTKRIEELEERYDSRPCHYLFTEREENDDEYNVRMKEEETIRKRTDENRFKLYNELKKEFEKNGNN